MSRWRGKRGRLSLLLQAAQVRSCSKRCLLGAEHGRRILPHGKSSDPASLLSWVPTPPTTGRSEGANRRIPLFSSHASSPGRQQREYVAHSTSLLPLLTPCLERHSSRSTPPPSPGGPTFLHLSLSCAAMRSWGQPSQASRRRLPCSSTGPHDLGRCLWQLRRRARL